MAAFCSRYPDSYIHNRPNHFLTVASALRTASGRALSLDFSVETKHFDPSARSTFIISSSCTYPK